MQKVQAAGVIRRPAKFMYADCYSVVKVKMVV